MNADTLYKEIINDCGAEKLYNGNIRLCNMIMDRSSGLMVECHRDIVFEIMGFFETSIIYYGKSK